MRTSHKQDKAIERWLREDVAPVHDAMKKEPSRGIPAAKVFAAIRTRHLKRLKANCGNTMIIFYRYLRFMKEYPVIACRGFIIARIHLIL